MSQFLPKRVVLDTNVCLDLFVFQDPRWSAIMNGIHSGTIEVLTGEDCRMEWLAVLHYPQLPVTDESRGGIIERFDQSIKTVRPEQKAGAILPRCSDKDDQKFLEITRDSGAGFLVTKDKALLKLAKKIRQAGLFSIETPEKFLKTLELGQ
jgi:putative PIN family toxin of toxin-antitoxin system